jgi:hypothetical protein
LPPLKEGEDIQLTANNNQAKLMNWHYHLGHLSFPKLKQLALIGEIPKKPAKVTPPKCAGCFFGAMTKLPCQGKETKASHEALIATKPGECISVNKMTSIEVGFFMQLKDNLPKSATNVPLSLSIISAALTSREEVVAEQLLKVNLFYLIMVA